MSENLISKLSVGESIIDREVAGHLQWKHAAALPSFFFLNLKGGTENTFQQETNRLPSTSLFCPFQMQSRASGASREQLSQNSLFKGRREMEHLRISVGGREAPGGFLKPREVDARH